MKPYHTLIERVDARFAGLRDDVSQAFGIVENVDAKAKAIMADRNLSAEGKIAAVRAEIAKGAAENLAQLRRSNQAAIASLAARRQNLGPKISDRTDAVAELRRAEIRRWLREMKDHERVRIVFGADREVIEAVADAPPAMSGLTEDMRDRAIDNYVEKTHGTAIANLAQEERALRDVEAGLEVAQRELEKLAGGAELVEVA